jgi:hypothetical protein
VTVDQARRDRDAVGMPEGYSLTIATAFDAARRVAAGDIKPGFHTIRPTTALPLS